MRWGARMSRYQMVTFEIVITDTFLAISINFFRRLICYFCRQKMETAVGARSSQVPD